MHTLISVTTSLDLGRLLPYHFESVSQLKKGRRIVLIAMNNEDSARAFTSVPVGKILRPWHASSQNMYVERAFLIVRLDYD